MMASMSDVPRYDLSSAPSDEQLSTIRALGEDLFKAELKVLQAESILKEAKKLRDDIAQNLIPQALDEAGLRAIETKTFRVEVEEVVRVQPRKENRPLVLQEIKKLGAGSLIQSTVSVPFSVNQEREAKALVDYLMNRGMQVKEDRSVHPSRLKKFIVDRLKAGEEVNMSLFGVTDFRRAKFTDGGPTPGVFEGEGS